MTRRHAIKNHQSGLPLADKISALFLVGIVGTLMVGPIAYSIHRDMNAPIAVQIDR